MKNKNFFFLLFTAPVFFLAYFIMISRMPEIYFSLNL